MFDLGCALEAIRLACDIVPCFYQVNVTSMDGGTVQSSSGICLLTERIIDEPVDSLVLIGTRSADSEVPTSSQIDYIRHRAERARRTAAIGTAVFFLARTGRLDGRQAVTSWPCMDQLQSSFPAIRVVKDSTYIQDGDTWTSGGMSAGLDMILAMIEDDLGREATRSIAQQLSLYYRRPGGQPQLSSLLAMDSEGDRIRNIMSYVREHLSEHLSVRDLACRAHLSVRQFNRAFLSATGNTPTKAIEKLRVEAARARVENGYESFDVIAQRVGFCDAARMCQSFMRIAGQKPQELRRRRRSSHILSRKALEI